MARRTGLFRFLLFLLGVLVTVYFLIGKNLHVAVSPLSIHKRMRSVTEHVVSGVDQTFPVSTTSAATIYCITPTFTRPQQKAELTKQCSTFRHVQNLVWIIVEDSREATPLVTALLDACPVRSVHLQAVSMKTKGPHRGVDQRNAGIHWVRETLMSQDAPSTKEVVYFADDDNTYDPRIFEEMRTTKNVSVWPVGLASSAIAERPIVINGKVVDFYTAWPAKRKFQIDMAGFAFHANYLLRDPCPVFKHSMPKGYLEDRFLTSLNITLDQLEPKANNCTEILVWHTQALKKKIVDIKQPLARYRKFNLSRLV